MISQRWLRSLIRLFPAEYRRTRGDELHDALAETHVSGWALLTESTGLLWAAVIAWVRFLATPTGVRHGIFMGALAWFGLLLSFGPIGRVQAYDRGVLLGFYEADARTQATIAAVLLIPVFFAALRSSVIAIALALPALCLSALSIRAGDWQFAQALRYEAEWIGVALAMALVVRARRRVQWPVAAVAVLPGLVLAVGPFGKVDRSPAYWGLSRLTEPATPTDVLHPHQYQIDHVLSTGWVELILIIVAVIVLVSPWVCPALAAAALPMLGHCFVNHRGPACLAVATYLAGSIWLRHLALAWLKSRRNERFA